MPLNCAEIKRLFDVEIIDYDRNGNDLIVSSGAGIGMATMDVVSSARYFFDIDKYRYQNIDFEALGIFLASKCKRLIIVGWFTIDVPKNIDALNKGFSFINKNIFRYNGGEDISLKDFFGMVK